MSYKAMWNNKNVITCASSTHCCSYTTCNSRMNSRHGIKELTPIPKGYCQYGTFRVYSIFQEGEFYPKEIFCNSPEYGQIMTIEQAEQLNRERGYSVPYGRNSHEFVQSRAARKRGYKSTCPFYLRRVSNRHVLHPLS